MGKLLEIETPTILDVYPGITQKQVDGISIGRVVLPETGMGIWTPDTTFLRFYNALNGRGESALTFRTLTVSSLNDNSPTHREIIAHERASSAYFTYNPKAEEVIIEWGMIDATGNAKLHTYLNRVIDYPERAKQGMQLSSGHLARVTGTETYLAYLDRLSVKNEFAPNNPMARMINTLHMHGFIPITAEGFVQIPFF